MAFRTDLSRGVRAILKLIAGPVRRSRGRKGVVVQPYRGYGSRERIFVIGRVFRQSEAPGGKGKWDVDGNIRDILRRIRRRPVAGARVRATFYGAQTVVETDRDGYFRIDMAPSDPVEADCVWHRLAISLETPVTVDCEADVYIPPVGARVVVISDIDDTVMHTGVANKLVMLWRLFVQSSSSRTAFPGVAHLYRALHDGAAGGEQNPMLYVSRAPWGIYEILEAFFQRHEIPVGPILFLREWGLSWKSPLPRRAVDHKQILIDAMMTLYHDLPVVLIGDSGQHDPEVYRHVVERFGGRVVAVYIRNVSLRNLGRTAEIEAMRQAVETAGSQLVLASGSLAMAEHAAKLRLIAPGAVETIRLGIEREGAVG